MSQQSRKSGTSLLRVLVVVALVVLAWVAFGPKSPSQAPAGGGGGGTTVGVQWADYAPGLQGRIDSLASSKDCGSLQTEFDNADANNNATLSRTGHNNAQLMGYIDDKMRAAGCYK